MNTLGRRLARLEGNQPTKAETLVVERVLVGRTPSGELHERLHSIRTEGMRATRGSDETEAEFRGRVEVEEQNYREWRAHQ